MNIEVQGILIGDSNLLDSTHTQTLHHFIRAEHPSQLHIQGDLIYRDKSL